MPRRLTGISLVLVLLLSSEVWAIGLGDIRLDSALNEPLRAEIDLLSATEDELAGLSVALASTESFVRYGIDKPVYLQDIEFKIRGDDAERVRDAADQLREAVANQPGTLDAQTDFLPGKRELGVTLTDLATRLCSGRMLSVLEGGYDLQALPRLVRSYLGG